MSLRISNSHKTRRIEPFAMQPLTSVLALSLLVVIQFQIGCGVKTDEFVIPHDHPANAEAPQAALEPPMGMTTQDVASHEDEKMEHHVAVSLPKASEQAFAEMLEAYFAVGDQLASDTMENVNAKTNEMLEALHTLEHGALAELWKGHNDHTQAIHDHGQELAGTSDIKTARVIYGSLSEAINYLITAIGAPARNETPVYRYICGMASDVPQGGVWLQKAVTARNPYFGSSMLRCYSEKTQMPVAAAKDSSPEAPGHDHHMHELGNHYQHQGHMQPEEHNPAHEHMKARD